MAEMIKVVWICHFSNPDVKKKIRINKLYYKKVLCSLMRKPCRAWNDYAVWNTNAIKQFEFFKDIDLTVVFPYPGIKGVVQRFDINGIHYVAFRSEDDNFLSFIQSKIGKDYKRNYKKNRGIVASVISEISPNIVHIIGAENPYYSIAALDIPDDIPSIITLQTLMSDPDFFVNYPISKTEYAYRTDIEQQIIKKCVYIGSTVERFRSIIRSEIKKDSIFLNISLPLGVIIDNRQVEKEFDFVYFAANINKAGDYAIEAFALACQKCPGLTLNVSGGYDSDYKEQLYHRLREFGVQEQVFFTGPQATHEDVINQIKKSRFALLPLKVDLISGTIREAMACGLPVVTTITPNTPDLNAERESILLSEKGDFQAMADNMIKLVENDAFADRIRVNALKTIEERYDNKSVMEVWRDNYYSILGDHK